ncbi:hypothetical protein [Thermovirga lienii]|uniref:YkvI family membrane protein n=1 Tax=Thermovirga lienii TaxID=336261 RepID=UPI002FE3FA9F
MAEKKEQGVLSFFMNYSWYRKYLLPGFVAQSVIIAGGYGTGRELVEYFLQYGPTGGLMGMGLTTILWAALFALSFEFARAFKAYDYRTFFEKLIGPGWIAYEAAFIVLLFLIMGVIGAASGSILRDSFGLPPIVGSGLFLIFVAYLTYSGSKAIEVALSWWSYVLYAVYIIFLYFGFTRFGGVIASNFSAGVVNPGWAMGGFKYAFYNIAIVSTVLFTLNYLETRKEAIISGIIAAIICILPAFLFYIVMAGFYPEALSMEVPATGAIAKLGVRFLLPIWLIVLFGTMIETGVGFFHSINERINATLIKKRGKGMSNTARGIVGATLALIGLAISKFGLIGLIAQGYGTISWVFFILQGVALFTIGIYKLYKLSKTKS